MRAQLLQKRRKRPKAVQVAQETLLDRDGRFQIYKRETLGMAADKRFEIPPDLLSRRVYPIREVIRILDVPQ